MEKKYQLVAWTRDVADKKRARVFMTPSLEHEMQEPYFNEIWECSNEEIRLHGHISASLARRYSWAYEQNAHFHILTGRYGDAIRRLSMAALYCTWADGFELAESDHRQRSRSHRELWMEFVRLAEEMQKLAEEHMLEGVLREERPSEVMAIYSSHPHHL